MRLYLLSFGTAASGTPYPGYLIQTDDGTNILVDTGFPPEVTGAYRQPGNEQGAKVDEEDYVLNRLAALGIAPEDIHYLIATHLDGDHAGNTDRFPNAEIVIQRAHREAAKTLDRFQRTRPYWDAPGLRYREVDGDNEVVPGVEVIESSGHVPGHQSVLVRLPQTGAVLLAIDAIPAVSQRDPETRTIGSYEMDEAGVRASTRKLMDRAARESATLVIHGHDADQWASLKKAPEYYE
jgi:N-acyl homoserine lactone hydrolase